MIRIGACALAALLAVAPALGQTPTITNLGVLPGGTASYANAVSADGKAVAGTSESTNGYRAFRWTAAGGMQILGTLQLGELSSTYGDAISGDGSYVAGTSFAYGCDPKYGCSGTGDVVRWWAADGSVQVCGPHASFGPGLVFSVWGSGISFDGSSAASSSSIHTDIDNYTAAYRWTVAAGLELLASHYSFLPAPPPTAANAINYSGSVVAGSTQGRAFRWTDETGIEMLGVLPGTSYSWGVATSGNGSALAGYCSQDSWGITGYKAFRWTQAGMQDLGVLVPGGSSVARGISGDGLVVAGADWYTAFLWTADLGMVDLNTYLPSLGLNLTGWVLTDARGLNSDGSVIVGNGYYNNEARAWLVKIPRPGDVTGDGLVNVDDLHAVIAALGSCPSSPQPCPADIAPPPHGNGVVNAQDILRVVHNFH